MANKFFLLATSVLYLFVFGTLITTWRLFADLPLDGADVPAISSRTLSYCSAGSSGKEGKIPSDAKGMELAKVIVLSRHGDRSACHAIPGAFTAQWSCQLSSATKFTMEQASRHFQVREITTTQVLDRSFFPATLQNNSLELCELGQLTEIGIKQLQSSGKHIFRAYKKFIAKHLKNPDALFVRSTDYPRTIQSTVAFLTSLLPKWKKSKSKIDIWTYEDFAAELMHGQGMKHEGQRVGGGEKVVKGTCPKAVAFAENENMHFNHTLWNKSRSMWNEIENLFGPQATSLKVTDLTDAVQARVCHDMNLPCSVKGCIQSETAFSLIKASHQMYCSRYNGDAGGAEATRLAMQPFLKHLLQEMEATLEGKSPHRFSLYVGHDTVVAPILSALGVYDCKWPPYASYITLELWSLAQKQHEPNKASDMNLNNTYFRIFFNGQPKTHLIKACSEEPGKIRSSGLEFKLCNFLFLKQIIDDIIKPFKTFEEACFV